MDQLCDAATPKPIDQRILAKRTNLQSDLRIRKSPPTFHLVLVSHSQPNTSIPVSFNTSSKYDEFTWDDIPNILKTRRISLQMALFLPSPPALKALHKQAAFLPTPALPAKDGYDLLVSGVAFPSRPPNVPVAEPTAGTNASTAQKRPFAAMDEATATSLLLPESLERAEANNKAPPAEEGATSPNKRQKTNHDQPPARAAARPGHLDLPRFDLTQVVGAAGAVPPEQAVAPDPGPAPAARAPSTEEYKALMKQVHQQHVAASEPPKPPVAAPAAANANAKGKGPAHQRPLAPATKAPNPPSSSTSSQASSPVKPVGTQPTPPNNPAQRLPAGTNPGSKLSPAQIMLTTEQMFKMAANQATAQSAAQQAHLRRPGLTIGANGALGPTTVAQMQALSQQAAVVRAATQGQQPQRNLSAGGQVPGMNPGPSRSPTTNQFPQSRPPQPPAHPQQPAAAVLGQPSGAPIAPTAAQIGERLRNTMHLALTAVKTHPELIAGRLPQDERLLQFLQRPPILARLTTMPFSNITDVVKNLITVWEQVQAQEGTAPAPAPAPSPSPSVRKKEDGKRVWLGAIQWGGDRRIEPKVEAQPLEGFEQSTKLDWWPPIITMGSPGTLYAPMPVGLEETIKNMRIPLVRLKALPLPSATDQMGVENRKQFRALWGLVLTKVACITIRVQFRGVTSPNRGMLLFIPAKMRDAVKQMPVPPPEVEVCFMAVFIDHDLPTIPDGKELQQASVAHPAAPAPKPPQMNPPTNIAALQQQQQQQQQQQRPAGGAAPLSKEAILDDYERQNGLQALARLAGAPATAPQVREAIVARIQLRMHQQQQGQQAGPSTQPAPQPQPQPQPQQIPSQPPQPQASQQLQQQRAQMAQFLNQNPAVNARFRQILLQQQQGRKLRAENPGTPVSPEVDFLLNLDPQKLLALTLQGLAGGGAGTPNVGLLALVAQGNLLANVSGAGNGLNAGGGGASGSGSAFSAGANGAGGAGNTNNNLSMAMLNPALANAQVNAQLGNQLLALRQAQQQNQQQQLQQQQQQQIAPHAQQAAQIASFLKMGGL
ncbi:hypothetical protein DL93DRAFT_1015160 [Clavulina sp. PMI_390]|nr:hypothetical protein DL93DRAFT_1015160 [Clavulina sp. PMI_390]